MSSSDPDAPPRQPDLLEKLEHLQHWWREPLAGVVAVGVACWDMWHFGSTAGFTSSLDEILLLTGVALIAGVRNLFGGTPERKPPPPGS